MQREVKALLQSALEVALSVVRANPNVLEELGAYLEGCSMHSFILLLACKIIRFLSVCPVIQV